MASGIGQRLLDMKLGRRRFLALAGGVVATGGVVALTTSAGTSASGSSGGRGDGLAAPVIRPRGWTDASHSKEAAPNYALVFPQDRVNQMTIRISPENWEAMLANMTQLFGARGTGGPGPGGPGGFGGPRPDGGANGARPAGPGQPGGGGGFGGGDLTPENPVWVPATIEFDGKTWTNVGVRFKGNSSLRSSWGSGSDKLPFKLDFDEFEDRYPEIRNQRVYGFKQLSLSNHFGDSSYLREAVTYNVLEEAGLVAAETAFYELALDHGEGPVNLGLYTVIEVIDDTVIERSFADGSGNIYEADGPAVSLANGTLDRIEASFEVESDSGADWSDIKALYHVLHSTDRTTNAAAWRRNLESTFNVDDFLKWLAISAALQHWDTYGAMTHNFYLYNDPSTALLTWISWDHNLVLGAGGGAPGGGAGGPGRGMGGRGNTSLDKKEVGSNWPLIRYLLDDATYYARYVDYLKSTVDGAFDPDKMEAKYNKLAELLAPYAARERDAETFRSAIQSLIQTTRDRARTVNDFLATQSGGNS